MADIDIGSIGGTLYLIDKGWSSTLTAAEKSLGSVDKAVNNFTSRLQAGQKVIDDYVAKARELGGVSEGQLFAFESISNALGAVEKAAGPAGMALKAVGVAVGAAGAAAVAAGGAIYAAANYSANLGDELLTMSKKTDISVESLSAWRYISEQVGVSLGTISNNVARFTGELGKGSKQFENAIKNIGLSISDLRNMKPEAAFQATIDAIAQVPNAADRAAVGMALFGKQFKELKPLIDEDTAAMRKDFEAFGGTITEEMAKAADAFNDSKARLGAMFEAIVVQLGAAFHAPITAIFTEIGNAFINTRKDISVDSEKFIETVDAVAEFIIAAAGNIIRVNAEMLKAFTELFLGSWLSDIGLVEKMKDLGKVISAVVQAQGLLTLNKGLAEQGKQIEYLITGMTEWAAVSLPSIKSVHDGIMASAEAAATFGKHLADSADGAVARVRASIGNTVETANGAFQGLAERADKEIEKLLERAQKRMEAAQQRMDKWQAAQDRNRLKDAERQAERLDKITTKMFLDSVKDAEDADRKMRRLTMSRVEFEIDELERRFDKEVEGFKSSGAGAELLQKRIEAAMKKTAVDIGQVVIRTEEFHEALLTASSIMMNMNPVMFAQMAEYAADAASEIGDLVTVTDLLREAFEGIGGDLVSSIFEGFREGGDLSDAIGGAAKTMSGALGAAMTRAAVANMGGFWGNIAGAAYTQILGFMVEQAIHEFDTDRIIAADREAEAMFTDILSQFGGSRRRLDEMMERAGVDRELQAKIRGGGSEQNWSNPEMLARQWDEARIALADYQSELDGLGRALQGVENIGIGMFESFQESADAQLEERLKAQDAIIAMMEEEGATAEELAQKRLYFAELNSGAIFSATETQVEQFNRLGTIAGGVIANIAGRTGDMVAAFQAAAGTLDPMLEISRRFNISDQLNASTEQVLKFYGIIKDNAEVFAAVQGVGQVFAGLGDAQIQNLELVNALGGQLEESALALQAAGVSVTDIYAMLSPQLQELWETVEDGELAVDETTRALLDQAEAQGVVGNSFREINEQILMVLTEIRDMFQDDLPAAVDGFAKDVEQSGNAIRRSISAVGDATYGTSEDVRVLGDELENLSKIRVPPIKARVDFEMGDMPDFPNDWNYRGNDFEPAEFRRGSYGFQQFGDGTPAYLHGLERVQTYSDYMAERRNEEQTIIVEIEGEAVVAANVRHQARYTRIRAGNSPRTIR